jgi:hypothetical protein
MNFSPDDAADPDNEIARLEDRIEQLAVELEKCRKYALAARALLVLGGALLLALLLGAIRFDGLAMAASIAAILGGIVLWGSNSSSTKEAAAQLAAAEAERNALIDQIELREITPRPTLH